MSTKTFKKQQEPFVAPVKTIVEDDGGYIELVTGAKFHYDNPVWDIGAIAHGLSLICRYTGQCRKFYSVAEHSILVSRIMEAEGGDPLEGLLHDATESVLADVARPAKNLLKDYQALEHALDINMRKHFEIPETATALCKEADWLALILEAREFMPSKGLNWYVPEGLRAKAAKLTFMPTGWSPDDAKSRFMTRVSEIHRLRRTAVRAARGL